MKSFLTLAVPLLLTCLIATTPVRAEESSDDAARSLVDRRLELQSPDLDSQTVVWKAEVLKKVIAVWERPSEEASSAKWAMRVMVDDQGRLLNLTWVTRTGNRKLDKSIVRAFEAAHPYPPPPDAESARAGIHFTDEPTARRDSEARLAANAARNAATLAEIQRAGPLQAYLTLTSFRYKKCEAIADEWLDIDQHPLVMTSLGFHKIEDCVADEEAALAAEVRLALQVTPEKLLEEIKGLHAYTVASLRALKNFNQSIVEARRARAERSMGIDERATRIGLEL